MTNESKVSHNSQPSNGKNDYEIEMAAKMEETFLTIQKSLKDNKLMIKKEPDGIYVRFAGDEGGGYHFSLDWIKVAGYGNSNTVSMAEREFEILEKTVKDPVILPFKEEILALVDKFGLSGQSGGSAPFTAGSISQAVKELCLQNTICPITGIEEEWNETARGIFQNNRLSSVFKDGKDGKPYYLEAIVFKGEGEHNTFTGSFKDHEGRTIHSRQYVRLPFKPKTFWVDVLDFRFDKDKETGELTPNLDGDWWEHELKDPSQLKEVFEYYDRY